jgi:4'-phosphopantetheinyl transferase
LNAVLTDLLSTFVQPRVSGLPGEGRLHLWSAQIPAARESISSVKGFPLISVLSADEQARAERYQVQAARHQFVVTRALLRILLAEYLQQDPKSLEFCYSIHGKPELLVPQFDLRFNLSHSKGVVLFAVCQGQSIGVDLEWINPAVDGAAIARRMFSAQERAEIARLPSMERQAKFFQLWTRKEALIKLFGDRLFPGLKTYEVSTDSSSCGQWARVGRQSVWLQDLELMESFAGAIATPTQPDRIRYRQWPWSSTPAAI